MRVTAKKVRTNEKSSSVTDVARAVANVERRYVKPRCTVARAVVLDRKVRNLMAVLLIEDAVRRDVRKLRYRDTSLPRIDVVRVCVTCFRVRAVVCCNETTACVALYRMRERSIRIEWNTNAEVFDKNSSMIPKDNGVPSVLPL